MRSPRPLLRTVSAGALVLAAVAVAAPAHAEPGFADPRAPRCTALTSDPQIVVVGELTAITTRCTSPSGAPLAVTAMHGSVTSLFGTLVYRADEPGDGYDKLTVHLAGVGPSGPGAVILVGLVER
ncbi:hypothetical protein [Herbiconiux sp. VKM Ac-2851]|uniref:hypothetical protein n=1 Tax=Herbiconiux sp. VKM Ac-2851 TaxID=2739025 RepID=UPI001567B124|nr:hypothetical protein [Herbiconiux sp. VKM Ac-2851]NQX36011.1 hypothetical protein [Herbiconiux sp. VKM Ac-2851]